MARAGAQTPKGPKKRTYYLDADGARALDFLKSRPALIPGQRFSNIAVFRALLRQLQANLQSILSVERHEGRAEERGRFLTLALSAEDLAIIEELDAFYREHAQVRHRVRDNVPKARTLPLSKIFSNYIKNLACQHGWNPNEG